MERNGILKRPEYVTRIPLTGKPVHDFDIEEIRLDESTSGLGGRKAGRSFASLKESTQLTGRQKRSLAFAAEEEHQFGEVWDEKGRRRFHGAFTGGFSAGYFNTVGSQEGWTPSQFSSSRAKRALTADQRISDIADEEDLQDLRTTGQTKSALPDEGITRSIQSSVESELSSSIHGIGEKLACQLMSHLGSGHPDYYTDDREFQLLYKRIKKDSSDTFCSTMTSSGRRMIGPQIIPKTLKEGQSNTLKDAVRQIRNYYEAESTRAVLHIFRTAHKTTPLRLIAPGGKALLSLPGEQWAQGIAKPIESHASILPTKELALIPGKSIRDLVAMPIETAIPRSEISLIETIKEQPLAATRWVMRKEEGRFPLDTGRLRDVPKSNLRHKLLSKSMIRNETAGRNRSGRIERNALAAADDDEDLLGDDEGGYDFEVEAEERYNIEDNGEGDELEGQSYTDRVAAKIKMAEKSYRYIPGFAPPTNPLLMELSSDWEDLARLNERPPRDFSLRKITPRMVKLAQFNRNRHDKTSHSREHPVQEKLKNELAERFAPSSSNTDTSSMKSKSEEEDYEYVRKNYPLGRFVNQWTPSKLLCKMLSIREPVPLMILPSRQEISNRMSEYFTSLRSSSSEVSEVSEGVMTTKNLKYPFVHRLPYIKILIDEASVKAAESVSEPVAINYTEALAAIFDSD